MRARRPLVLVCDVELKNIDFNARRVIVAEGTYTEAKPHHPFGLGSTAATKRTEENGGNYVRTHRLWLSHPIDTGINLKNFACDPSKLEDIPLLLNLVTIAGGLEIHFYPDHHVELAFSGEMLGSTRLPIVDVSRELTKRYGKQLDEKRGQRCPTASPNFADGRGSVAQVPLHRSR